MPDIKMEKEIDWAREDKEWQDKRQERESRLVVKIRTALDELLMVQDSDDSAAKVAAIKSYVKALGWVIDDRPDDWTPNVPV